MTRTRSSVRLSVLATAVVAGLALTACGEEGSGTAADPAEDSTSTPTDEASQDLTEEPTEEPSEEAKGPACTDVWVAGATLPESYQGCQDAEQDRWVEAMVYHCSSGQRLVTFRRNFYAAKGEVINESETPLARDPDFQKVLATCGA